MPKTIHTPECEDMIFKICQLLGCRQPTPTTACAINALLTSRLNASFIAGNQLTEARLKECIVALEHLEKAHIGSFWSNIARTALENARKPITPSNGGREG